MRNVLAIADYPEWCSGKHPNCADVPTKQYSPSQPESKHHDASLPLDRTVLDWRVEGIGRSYVVVSRLGRSLASLVKTDAILYDSA